MPRAEPPKINAIAELYLAFLAENPEELARFMADAGLSPDALRGAVGSAALAHGLLDHLVANEASLLAVCANSGLDPETIMRVWHRANPS